MKLCSFDLLLLKAFHAQSNLFRPMAAQLGLSFGQPKILNFLVDHDGCKQKDLAEMCDIKPATISRLLDKMEADGLIFRAGISGNKRAMAIHLTDLGRFRQSQLVESRRVLIERELTGFSEEERRQFSSYLSRLYDNLTCPQKGGEV